MRSRCVDVGVIGAGMSKKVCEVFFLCVCVCVCECLEKRAKYKHRLDSLKQSS